MGMDYVARRTASGTLHLNWAIHSGIGRCLDLLGADLSEWSGANSGDLVSAATCRSWANLLSTAMAEERIRLCWIDGRQGKHRVLVVAGSRVQPDSLAEALDMIDLATGRGAPHDGMPTTDLDEMMTRVLKGFIEFMLESGGCRQQ